VLKVFRIPVSIFILLLLAACQAKPVCPPSTSARQYLSPVDMERLSSSEPVDSTSPVEVKINGKMMTADKVVTGPLCNDNWKGTVYVGCDVQVFKWEGEPLFLKSCNLSIEPGTVVYVAYHNNAAYYNGCSCHTGEERGSGIP